MSNSLRPHGLQHVRPPCPSPTPRVYSNSCPLSWWCHPTISSSVVPFSSHLQSFPASGSLLMSRLFASSGQSIGASASASVLPMKSNIFTDFRDWGLALLFYLHCAPSPKNLELLNSYEPAKLLQWTRVKLGLRQLYNIVFFFLAAYKLTHLKFTRLGKQVFAIPRTVTHQATLSIRFSGKNIGVVCHALL